MFTLVLKQSLDGADNATDFREWRNFTNIAFMCNRSASQYAIVIDPRIIKGSGINICYKQQFNAENFMSLNQYYIVHIVIMRS